MKDIYDDTKTYSYRELRRKSDPPEGVDARKKEVCVHYGQSFPFVISNIAFLNNNDKRFTDNLLLQIHFFCKREFKLNL